MKLYTWKTPNGYKVPILLEELGVAYELIAVDITKGEQKTPEYLAMNPNHKIPVLVDTENGGLTIFESGAILIYLAGKYKKFLSEDIKPKFEALEWLMFQMASVGPMFGQVSHFIKYAPEPVPYAIKRYTDESARLMGVLETRLSQAPYLAGEYGIADIATWPWVRAGVMNKLIPELSNYPAVEKWYKAIESRDAVKRAIEKVDAVVAAKQ